MNQKKKELESSMIASSIKHEKLAREAGLIKNGHHVSMKLIASSISPDVTFEVECLKKRSHGQQPLLGTKTIILVEVNPKE